VNIALILLSLSSKLLRRFALIEQGLLEKAGQEPIELTLELKPEIKKNEKLKLNKIKFSCGFKKILNIELKVIK
jgi:hypothetical protein